MLFRGLFCQPWRMRSAMQEAACDVLGRREGDNVGTDKNKEYIEIGDMTIQEQIGPESIE